MVIIVPAILPVQLLHRRIEGHQAQQFHQLPRFQINLSYI